MTHDRRTVLTTIGRNPLPASPLVAALAGPKAAKVARKPARSWRSANGSSVGKAYRVKGMVSVADTAVGVAVDVPCKNRPAAVGVPLLNVFPVARGEGESPLRGDAAGDACTSLRGEGWASGTNTDGIADAASGSTDGLTV